MPMHQNSLAAYYAERDAGRLSRRARAVLADVQRNGPGTDRQIRDRMGFDDMNHVRPRITELVQAGELRETGRVVDPVTGKRVRVVDVTA